MPKIMSVHSYRGQVGKTTLVANLAVLLASQGKRVCLVDIDFARPHLHQLFRLSDADLPHSLSDYLLERCNLDQVIYEVTGRLGRPFKGQVFLVTANGMSDSEATILNEGYNPEMLKDALDALAAAHRLDYIILDTRAGLDAATLPLYALTDILTVTMGVADEDFQGTSVIVEIARKIDVPETIIAVFNLPEGYDPDNVRDEVERAYKCPVACVVPHVDLPRGPRDTGLVAVDYPNSPMVVALMPLALRFIHYK